MATWKQLSPSTLHRSGSILAYGATDIGCVRKANEDNFLIDEELGLFLVADGMGGHDAGEVASEEAALAMARHIRRSVSEDQTTPDDDDTVPDISHFLAGKTNVDLDPDATWSDGAMPALGLVHDAVGYANAHLYSLNIANQRSDGRGMGTTLVGWWQHAPGAPIVAFNVGDSRMYLLRGGQLSQLSKDQTLYQQALDMGQTGQMPPRNLLLQAVGPSHSVTPEVFTCRVEPGDLYLLCSDGLHSELTAPDLQAILAKANPDNLPEVCGELIAAAIAHGGRDNVTVLLAYGLPE